MGMWNIGTVQSFLQPHVPQLVLVDAAPAGKHESSPSPQAALGVRPPASLFLPPGGAGSLPPVAAVQLSQPPSPARQSRSVNGIKRCC